MLLGGVYATETVKEILKMKKFSSFLDEITVQSVITTIFLL